MKKRKTVEVKLKIYEEHLSDFLASIYLAKRFLTNDKIESLIAGDVLEFKEGPEIIPPTEEEKYIFENYDRPYLEYVQKVFSAVEVESLEEAKQITHYIVWHIFATTILPENDI